MKIEKIDLLMPENSQYNALHHMTQAIHRSLRRIGYQSRLIAAEEHFTLPIQEPADLTLAINGIPIDDAGVYLCEYSGVPHLAYLIDPPYRYLHLLRSPLITLANDDASGCRLLAKQGHTPLLIPHGVERELATSDLNGERDIDLLFFATYIDYARRAEQWRDRYGDAVASAMHQAAEVTLYDASSCFMHAFEEAYNTLLKRGAAHAFVLNLVDILTDLELYVKGRSRTELVKAFKHCPLLLFNGSVEKGYGWERALGDNFPHITLLPPVHYHATFSYLKRAKVVLNSFVKNKEGAHDRIFNAMACGCCVVTNETLFMRKHFKNGRELLFYQPWKLDDLETTVSSLLTDEAWRHQMTESGRNAVLAHHTWDQRFEAALEALS